MNNEKSKNKILLLIISFLLLTNIAMLVFLLTHEGRGKRSGHGGRDAMVTEFLQQDIGFNTLQMQQYDTLSKKHHEQIRAVFDEARKNKETQLKQLAANGFSDSVINVVAGQSSEKQKSIEINMFSHIKNVRTICTPDQRPKFDSLIYKIIGHKGEGKGR